MIHLPFQIKLLADAEPGTGLGTELLDDTISRDHRGWPVLWASHLKGLMRDCLSRIGDQRSWSRGLDEQVFGRPGIQGNDGLAGLIRVSDATPEKPSHIRTITRTALNDLGTADGSTLRTSEAVPAGTVFCGQLEVDSDKDDAVDLAARLSLLALEAVGGGRNRGSGSCLVTMAAENRSPGDLLKALDPLLPALVQGRAAPVAAATARAKRTLPAGAPEIFRLVFRAEGPVCCPETPLVQVNVIRSGIAIPASAVQGMIVTQLAKQDPQMADACFEDSRFRAWPLLPADLSGENPAQTPVRVSLSHRMSKLPGSDGAYWFEDSAIEPYDWQKMPAHAPLKASDGVLLRGKDGKVKLWRAADMPRLVTAHGVHHDPEGQGRRNLFTVEAMAPMVWTGWVALPPGVLGVLERMLSSNPMVAFGRSRSVSGSGRIELAPAESDLSTVSVAGRLKNQIFVLQSPAAIPDSLECSGLDAVAILGHLVRESGWGVLKEDGLHQASCGVRFGWNRHAPTTNGATSHRIAARRVVLPGSVFILEQPVSHERLLRGLGIESNGDIDGRTQGFGAVLPHPGKASTRFEITPAATPTLGSPDAGKLGYKLWSLAGAKGPSASQIGSLIEKLSAGTARQYLESRRERPTPRWRVWENHVEPLSKLLASNNPSTAAALRVWQDLAVANASDQEPGR